MSSRITNFISTVYSANAGNALAVMNQMYGGMNNLGRAINNNVRQSGMLTNQWRAMATTLRYSIAGATVFGAYRLVNTLRETQRQLALIGAIGGFDELYESADRADAKLQELYIHTQRGSLATLTPVSDFNNALINLFSTVQGLDPSNAVRMTTAISRGAQLAQVSAEDLTRATAGMAQAFGDQHNLQNYQQYIRGFYTLTSQAPGGVAYGPQFIQQLAPLAAVSRFANIQPEQMFGLYLSTLRTGGTPATAGRGLQYLLQSIAVPASDEAGRALRRAGITPATVQQEGGISALNRLIEYSRTLIDPQTQRRIAGLSEDQITMLEEMPPEQAMGTLGISGRGLAFMSEAIGRIHGIRALVTLMAQGGQVGGDITTMERAMGDTVEAQAEYARKWEEFARRQPLQAAATSIDVIRRQMISAAEPGINIGARAINWAGARTIENPERTRNVIYGAGAFMAAMGLARFMRGGQGIGGGIRGLFRGAGQAFVATTATQAAMTQGGAGPGMSPQNPLYVIVVGELFGGRSTVPPVTTPPVAPVPTGGRGKWAKRVGRGGLAAIAAAVGYEAWGFHEDNDIGVAGINLDNVITPADAWRGIRRRWGGPRALSPAEQAGRNRSAGAVGQDARIRYAQQFVPGMTHLYRTEATQINGRAMVTLDVRIDRDGKITRKRVHVPMDLWTNGRAPGSRGQ